MGSAPTDLTSRSASSATSRSSTSPATRLTQIECPVLAHGGPSRHVAERRQRAESGPPVAERSGGQASGSIHSPGADAPHSSPFGGRASSASIAPLTSSDPSRSASTQSAIGMSTALTRQFRQRRGRERALGEAGRARLRAGIVTALTACGVLDAGVAPRRQNVLMNSIRARLSSSLNTGSAPNAFSSSLRPSVSLNFAVPK